MNMNIPKLSKIVKKDTFKEYQILIGRNAKMNDILTTIISDDNDIWLHAKGVPGSHILIKNPNNLSLKEFPRDAIEYAATIAIKNSKSDSENGEVVYTLSKNVYKKDDLPDGKVMVDYKKSKIIKV